MPFRVAVRSEKDRGLLLSTLSVGEQTFWLASPWRGNRMTTELDSIGRQSGMLCSVYVEELKHVNADLSTEVTECLQTCFVLL